MAGERALRLLNVTRDSSGRPRVSGAMAFIPVGRAPRGGRPVVAWAHPTRSPENIAPSSSPDPLSGMEPWLHAIVRRGWIGVATDYMGLGTAGRQHYLGGAEEAGDIVDSVLAVHHPVGATASRQWVAWGATYGGHAVLWTASQAGVLAPELRLDGAAAAPVADLVEVEHAQGQTWATEVAKQDPPPQVGVPILIVQGTRDAVVPVANTEKVKVSWCAPGAELTLVRFPGATHESVVSRASRTVVVWVADRFDGRPVVLGC